MKKTTGFLSLTIVTLCIAILFAGCTGTAPTGQNTGNGTAGGIQARTPDLIVPATVPGFVLELKDTNNTTMYPYEVASAATLYKPALNSSYEGNVAYLAIYIDQFTNATTADAVYGTQNGTAITIGGYTAKYTYDPDAGGSYIGVENGDILIQSLAIAPENSTIDQAILKDAAQKGMESALNNI